MDREVELARSRTGESPALPDDDAVLRAVGGTFEHQSPADVAHRTLAAIQAGELYIFPHPLSSKRLTDSVEPVLRAAASADG